MFCSDVSFAYGSGKIKKPVNTAFYEPLDSVEPLKVGMAGFEPATSWSQTRRDTGLRYTPKRSAKVTFKIIAANIF